VSRFLQIGQHYDARDPESGCRLTLDVCIDSGRIAAKYDDFPVVILPETETGTLESIAFKLLRRHIAEAHPDMSFVELAAR
jgi:hypothetical protein